MDQHDSSSNSRFQYEPLPQDSIRLLKLQPGDDNAISCSLSTTVLGSSTSYTALSYTWGDPLFHYDPSPPSKSAPSTLASRSATIICDGRELKVTKSLEEALARLKNRPHISALWIDGICINQDDIAERSAQVLKMGEIYSSADMVLVWLGPASDGMQQTVDNLRTLAAIPESMYEVAQGYGMSDPAVYKLLDIDKPLTTTDIQDIALFLLRKWFTRIWIVQEVILAQQILVCLGDIEVEWDVIVKASEMIQVTRWNSSLTRSLRDVDKVWKAISIPSTPMIIRDLRNQKDKYISFSDCLTLTRSFDATIPHDQIYGLLGLVQPFVRGICAPNYAESLDLVLTKAAYAQIRENKSLHILDDVEDYSLRKLKTLPSWVPDLTSGTTTSRLEGHYHACPNQHYNIPAVWTIPGKINIRLLPVRGYEWDSVAATGDDDIHWYSPGHGIVASLNLLMNYIPLKYPNNGNDETRLTALWRTLISNRSTALQYPASEDMALKFRYYLKMHVGDVWAENQAHPGDLTTLRESQKLLEQLAITDGHDLVPQRDEITDFSDSFKRYAEAGDIHIPLQPCQAFSERMFVALYGRRLFATAKGHLGIAAKSLQPGDTVWILPGLQAPVILRVGEEGCYKFVGVSYVHGIMEGEALNNCKPLRDIQIE